MRGFHFHKGKGGEATGLEKQERDLTKSFRGKRDAPLRDSKRTTALKKERADFIKLSRVGR